VASDTCAIALTGAAVAIADSTPAKMTARVVCLFVIQFVPMKISCQNFNSKAGL
jgi:hypothetical protein